MSLPLNPVHPVWRHALELHEAPRASDHGLALGDGMLGTSIWGDGRPLLCSLDRADLWDLRDIAEYHRPEYRWDHVARVHAAGGHDELKALLEAPYDRAGPSRISAGRLALTFASDAVRFRLERATGQALVTFRDGAQLEAFINAEASISRCRVRDAAPLVELFAPPFGGRPSNFVEPGGLNLSRHHAWDLGYKAPVFERDEGLASFLQVGWGGFAFVTAIAWKQQGAHWLAAWTVASGREDDAHLRQDTIRQLHAALARDFDTDAATESAWWADYWSRGAVHLPEQAVERVYYSGMAQLGAAARAGRPPASLQGVWTSDDDRLPPWKGDYHHDLNTQMTYWPCYAGDQLSAGLSFLDWLWETRPACIAWTERFFGVPGLNVPMTADLLNRQIGGWRQYTHSVATSAWLAHHFYLHWRFSQDRTFLAERAFPYLSDVCTFIEAISAARDEQGLRRIALSSSPEVNDNRPEAWFAVFTNYDLSLFRWALAAVAELADALGRQTEALRWRRVLAGLPPLAVSSEGELLVAPGLPYPGHHRHFSHALAVHPLGEFTAFDPSEDTRRIARATVTAMTHASRDFWMGYSHAWHAAMAARIGDGEAARASLVTFDAAFVFPNGFHANGDWKRLGVGKAPFGAFTLEGAMGAADAVQTMLLQSRPGLLRLFPALPADWKKQVKFDGLRADGAILVSAAVENGALVDVELRPHASVSVQLAVFDREPALELNLVSGRTAKLDADDLARLVSGGSPVTIVPGLR